MIDANREIKCPQLSHDRTCPHCNILGSLICTENLHRVTPQHLNQFRDYSFTLETFSFVVEFRRHLEPFSNW
uniref:Uncharacterized protein n=1 Tax=Arundo donax TaxID=35708 RepID=A0A0A9H786_ARUDO